jgi:hypothetical protein
MAGRASAGVSVTAVGACKLARTQHAARLAHYRIRGGAPVWPPRTRTVPPFLRCDRQGSCSRGSRYSIVMRKRRPCERASTLGTVNLTLPAICEDRGPPLLVRGDACPSTPLEPRPGLSSPNTDASAALYRELMGWSATESGPAEETGGYRILPARRPERRRPDGTHARWPAD